MSRTIYELQGFAIALDKVAFVSRVFDADSNEGFQFNVAFYAELKLPFKFAKREEAELNRQLFLKALKD
jgi:hypothetical protein